MRSIRSTKGHFHLLSGRVSVMAAAATPATASYNSQEHGFARPGMYQEPLAGTVTLYQRHVFVCFKDAGSWAANAELDGLPRQLSMAIKARRSSMPKKVRLTVCEEGAGLSRGDLLVFPEALCYRGLAPSDVDAFVEEVLVKEQPWRHDAQQVASGYVFVCAHGSRDARCGACGPPLVHRFREEAASRRLRLLVSGCSHIGGHKFAGNVIIFSGSPVTGHWYGYVTPEDVPVLVDDHIRHGQIVDRLWRGQMCLSDEEQKLAHEQRQQTLVDKDCCPCGMSRDMCGMVNSPLAKSPTAFKSGKSTSVKQGGGRGAWSKRHTVISTALAAGAAAVLLYHFCN